MSLLVQLEFKARAEAEFLRIARALASAATAEPETLRYQWFATATPGHYSILEEYVDADAAEAHNHRQAELLREFFTVAELVSASFYGELNQYLRDWIAGKGGIAVNTPL
ncbi:MAG TPA: antibiotic biosynthesis monooxygenase [Kofleriaceae bacterium]|jgi:quinol monooxygenase YgiN|nr:antibiotic biosynthesis monooxygenase [Kofleriaceae bacterium]